MIKWQGRQLREDEQGWLDFIGRMFGAICFVFLVAIPLLILCIIIDFIDEIYWKIRGAINAA